MGGRKLNYNYNDSPGPGAYKFNGSIGKQLNSTAVNEPAMSMPKARRGGYNTNDTPGPGAYSNYYYKQEAGRGHDFGTGDREAYEYMYWK